MTVKTRIINKCKDQGLTTLTTVNTKDKKTIKAKDRQITVNTKDPQHL